MAMGCAATQRYGLRQCPTVQASLVDFTVTAGALVVAILAHGAGNDARAVTWLTGGGAIAVSSHLAECSR